MKITKKSFQSFFTRASFAGLLLVGAAAAQAQTNGTLTGTTTAYNYSTAPWVISSGTGTYPDGGGVATFGPLTGATPGTAATNSNITLDVSPTLSQINVNSPFYYNLVLGTGSTNTLIAANTGLTINTQATAQPLTTSLSTIFLPVGFAISAPISGGGTAGLTKTGAGVLYLAGTNTYTGGTHFNGGITNIVGGDVSLGATGAGNGLSFNGGAAYFSLATTSARDIFIDTGGATIYSSTATTLSGVISGTGTLTQNGVGTAATAGAALTLTGASTYTGATATRLANVITILSGAGSIATSSSYDLMGTFTLDNTGTNVANRLSDTAPMTLRGINFISTGNAGATSSETIGAVTGNSLNTFLVTPGGGTTTPQANSLTMASLARQNNSTFAFRGAGLGGTPGAGVANIYSTAAPTLVGGAGGAGTTNISIVPYAFGNSTTSTTFTPATAINSSLVTYGANGFRPLAIAEYATAFGVSPTDNVRITDGTTASPTATVTANAVLLAPATVTASALSGTINVTSGAFLYSPSANVAGAVSANLNFGTAEGVIMNTSTLTMSGVLSGSNGLTLSQGSAPTSTFTPNLTLSGANTYTGNTTINSGLVGYSGTIDNGTAGSFGTSGTVILNAGVNLAGITATAANTFNRNLSVIGLGNNYISAANSGYTLTFNGNISLGGNLYVYGYTNVAANAVNFNGVISGAGTIYDNGSTYGVFSGNNTYSGGTILASSTYYAGSDTAFGTGTFTFRGGTLAGVGTAARTLANPILMNGATSTFGGTAPLTLTGGVNLNGTSTLAITNTALTTFSGVLSSGAVTKTGTGAVAFNSTTGNTFTGGFVNTGVAATSSAIYANNNTGSAFGTGAVSVGAGSATAFSTLAGNFTTSGATTIGGRLSPGNGTNLTAATAGQGSIGTLNFSSSLTLSSATTSSMYLEIASLTNYDRINVGGAFTLAGVVNIATIGGYSISAGQTFDFADFASITGTATFNTAGATFDPGVTLDTSRFNIDGTVTAVPEPGTWVAVVGGLGVLGTMQFARRRRNRSV